MLGQRNFRHSSWCYYFWPCILFAILICAIIKDCAALEEVDAVKNDGSKDFVKMAVDIPEMRTVPLVGIEETLPKLQGKVGAKTNNQVSNREGRGMSSVFGLDPIGMLKSASRVLTRGVHTFRESLHEGVKVAQMLKDDVDEGVTQIWGQKASKNNNKNNKEHLSDQSSDDENMKDPTEESASDPQSFNEDQGKYSNQQQTSFREGMLGGIGGILRFMNVDSSRLGIIALNLLIYVAEMITSSLLGKDNSIPEQRAIKANILEYVATGHSKMLDNLMKDAKSETLPESLIETLQDKTGNDTSCVQLLICKMSPLIWSVQKTLDNQNQPSNEKKSSNSKPNQDSSSNSRGAQEEPRSGGSGSDSEPSIIDNLYTALPSKVGFVNYGDKCEKRFPNCRLLKFVN